MKAHFVDNLHLVHIPGKGRNFTLFSQFLFVRTDGTKLKVLNDFTTDGASNIRLLWWLFPPFAGTYLSAAVLHDALYAEGVFSRKLSDEIFLEAMEACQTRWIVRYAIYLGVRIGGWSAWRKHRKHRSAPELHALEVLK